MLYFDTIEAALSELNDQQAGQLIRGIVDYAKGDKCVEFTDPLVRVTFKLLRPKLDMDESRYSSIIETRRKAGIASGAARRTRVQNVEQNEHMLTSDRFVEHNEPTTTTTPTTPTTTTTTTPTTAPTEITGASAPKRTRFVPPTVDQVREYCRSRCNQIDAQHFVDFYAAKGWRVGNAPMRDWHAAVRTWEQRDKTGFSGAASKRNPALNYEQRNYTKEEANDVFSDPENDALFAKAYKELGIEWKK